MRGALLVQAEGADQVGIIPADAGSTACPAALSHAHGDHPRRCGEHTIRFPQRPDHGESSPQMRGALIALDNQRHALRIIPADAGSTLVFWRETGIR